MLGGFGFDTATLVVGVLGFNVGIGAFQLLVILVAVPWLVILAQTRAYPTFCAGGAALTGLAAATWLGERAFGWHKPVGPVVENVARHAPLLVVVLALATVVAYASPQSRAPRAAT